MISESAIEEFSVELLEGQGYQYLYGPDIAPDGEFSQRDSFEECILAEKVRKAIDRINPQLPSSAKEEAVLKICNLSAGDLVAKNQQFHRYLTEGIHASYQENGQERGVLVWPIDFESPENNEFLVVNQFTVVEDHHNKRPDIVLFVNGLPLVVIELKNPTEENANVETAYDQIQSYKHLIPGLFSYNSLLIVSDGLEAKAGTISSEWNRFAPWKSSDGESEASNLIGQLETLIKGMLDPKTLLDLIRNFTVFEKSEVIDEATGLISSILIKKMAAYHQYYAVNKAVKSTLRASGHTANKGKDITVHRSIINDRSSQTSNHLGDRKGGVIWHTQGSGKSLSMVFYVGKIILALDNPTIVIITDRNDLDDQLFDTFAASKQLLRQDPIQAESREHLKSLLKVSAGGVVFTTIQKFQPEDGNIFETLSERKNIVVIADEAHRTQYGFKAKTIDEKDLKGSVIGKKVAYGFAKYMRDALPNATYLGFTGTPIESADINTAAVFGDYIDIYDIAQAVNDGATVKIFYESRLAKITLSEEGRRLINELDNELEDEELLDTQKAKSKWTQLEALIGSKERIRKIAKDIIEHFKNRQEVLDGKVMVVAMSRRIAADLYQEIIKLKPEWHSPNLKNGTIKVVMTANSSDGPEISLHHTTKKQRRELALRMKNPKDSLKIVIVRDMWLTGFDVPSLHTLYIDKPMRGHNLMQAIARVNRIYKDKTGGLIVDYLGIASDLKQALSFYSDAGGQGDPTSLQEDAVNLFLEKIEIIEQLFEGFDLSKYFRSDTRTKLHLILAAEEHILSLENGKKRFMDEVTALSQAFSLSVPHDLALNKKDEVAFFQAVKARLAKFNVSGKGRTQKEIESAIKQVIDQALITEQVIDVFDAAGIKKPEISILSDEFLSDIRGMEYKHLAMEVLRKLLNDEIKDRMRINLVLSRTLMELLESSIRRYQNKIISAAEVIEELIHLSKDIQRMDLEPKEMNLTNYEYAFYTAIANNNSAKELMQKDKLRELAIVLFQKVKENASIDWNIKESVRAKLKVIVKRILRSYGYPPDMEALATETVLQQAEKIAEELTNTN